MKNFRKDGEKQDGEHKLPAPEKFVPTELGSAIFANIGGRPSEREVLIKNNEGQDDVLDANSYKGEDQ